MLNTGYFLGFQNSCIKIQVEKKQLVSNRVLPQLITLLFSYSMLPAYCDPPNPCPIGYTEADGCIEDFENTSDFSRQYQVKFILDLGVIHKLRIQ